MFIARLIIAFALLAGFARANDGLAAVRDLATLPVELQPFVRYVTTSTAVNEQERICQEAALRLIVTSSSRQENLAYCVPVRITDTLWRIDLNGLQWNLADWITFVSKYPYEPHGFNNPTVVRADWLIEQLSDQNENDGYLRFVFGKVPANRDEALAILAVDDEVRFRFGLIQGSSGVSVSGTRWIENRPISRGYCWGTRDSIKLDGDSDPLERPDGSFVHDGEEWIIGLPKFDARSGERGALQVYFLSNGQGNLVARAPVDLVRDHLSRCRDR